LTNSVQIVKSTKAHLVRLFRQDYRISTAQAMSVDIDATPDLLLLIQQKLCIMQYWYGSVSIIYYKFPSNISANWSVCKL